MEDEERPIGRNRGAKTMHAKQHKNKKYHITKAAALIHWQRMWLKLGDEGMQYMDIYECRWGDTHLDGQNAPVHWHIGHLPGTGVATGYTGGRRRNDDPQACADA